mgnify:CR=1 FL=1
MDKESLIAEVQKKINSFTFCRRVSFDALPNVSSLSRNAQASRAATLRLFHYALWCKSRLDFPLSHSLHVSVPRFMQPCRGFKTAAKMSPCITAECQLPGNEKKSPSLGCGQELRDFISGRSRRPKRRAS